MKDKKWKAEWKEEIIAAALLLGFAFFINRGIEIKGLYMDDLYLWSCYGEQSFREFVFPLGSTRFRFVYYLAAWLELMVFANHIGWFVPFNILLNSCIAYTVYRFGKRLSGRRVIGFLCGILYLLSRMSYYQISQVYGLMESIALWAAIGIFYCLYRYLSGEEERRWLVPAATAMYFSVCFIHERYMVLLPLFYAAFLMKKERSLKPWLSITGSFLVVQAIRFLTIGSISPAGTGGTDVADTFHLSETIRYALSQVLYLFGINAGPDHLNGLSWGRSPYWVHVLVVFADFFLLIMTVIFLVTVIRERKQLKKTSSCNLLVSFIYRPVHRLFKRHHKGGDPVDLCFHDSGVAICSLHVRCGKAYQASDILRSVSALRHSHASGRKFLPGEIRESLLLVLPA